MKRDPHLNPLSWQHQRTLALAHRTGAALDKASVPLEPLMAEIESLWRQEIEPHFHAEETILFSPAQALGVCRDEIKQVLQEHRRLRELAGLIERGDAAVDQRCHLREFAELLIRHIRLEERTVFPALEKALSKEQLEVIGRDLSAFHEQTRPDACSSQPSREASESRGQNYLATEEHSVRRRCLTSAPSLPLEKIVPIGETTAQVTRHGNQQGSEKK